MRLHPLPPPAALLTREKAWQWDGITVLTADAALPQLGGDTRRTRRFDRYYALLADAYFAHCAQKLFPRAAEECRAAMARSGPWRRSSAALSCRMDAPAGDTLRFTFEARENGALLRRWTDVWDSASLLPLTRKEIARLAAAEKKEPPP